MGLAIGIDLGTTNSCVAVVREGKARVVQDTQGVALHPSVVSFHPDGRVLVGKEARERRVIDPRNTFFSVKRLIGRDYSDPDVRRVAERYPYTLVEGPNGIPLAQARGKEYTLPEICSIILGHLREISEATFSEQTQGVVITVPANFNDVQRSSTRVAGRIADLEVLRILNEPTAAALAYGYGQGLSERVAVYDFGGGTFDITILDLRENVFEVLATAGDMFLGGDDFDARLVDQMVAAFLQLHHVDLRDNPIAMQRFRSVAEQIKCQLSSRPQVSARIRELDYGPGGKPLDMNFAVTRDGFEQRVNDLVDRTFAVCDEAFRLAEMSPAQLDNVILVGGSTRIPLVRQRVTEYFGREPRADINPDEVVAIGAAIQAYALVGQQPKNPSVPAGPKPREPIGRPIGGGGATGVAPDPYDSGEFSEVTSATATAPFIGSLGEPSSPRSTQQGMPAAREDMVRTAPDPKELLGKATMPGKATGGAAVLSAAAAAFGGEIPDDLPSPRAEEEESGYTDISVPQKPPLSSPGSGAAAAFGGDIPDDLPSPRVESEVSEFDLPAFGTQPPPAPGSRPPPPPPAPIPGSRPPPPPSGAAAAFGGEIPDDLPSPRAEYEVSEFDLPAPPAPRPSSGAAAAFGGEIPDDLPSPRVDGFDDVDLPAPPASQGQGFGSGAAAAFGGEIPDDLPSPRSDFPQSGDPGAVMAYGGDPAPPSGPTTNEDIFADSFSWGAGGDFSGTSEESVVGTFTEEMMAPAAIGRPPTLPPGTEMGIPDVSTPGDVAIGTPAAEAPVQAPTEGWKSSQEEELPFDEGRSWDVLSMPGTGSPQVAPTDAEYVDSAVHMPKATPVASATGAAGVQAPGVAPLPAHLLQELGVNHILIDVTPRTLAIQTVQGFCDPIIERNSPIPCEQSRVFTTSRDNQTAVVVRICQGESRRVDENIVLGEVSLTSIRPAPRGDVRVAVTFEIDTDGIVNVSARDVDTGQEATTKVTVFGGMAEQEVRDMLQRYGRA